MFKQTDSSRIDSSVAPGASHVASPAVQELQRSSEIVEVSRWVAEHLNHRALIDDRKRVLSLEQLPLLIDPLTTRIQAGILPQTESYFLTFTLGVTNGGIPLELFIKDPCINLSMNDVTTVSNGTWLPPI